MNRRRSPRAAALYVVSMAVGLIWTASVLAAPVTQMNPRDKMAVKLKYTSVGQNSYGNRTLSFTDKAVADGGNPAGTVFTVYLAEHPKGSTAPLTAADLKWTATKKSDNEETFTFDPFVSESECVTLTCPNTAKESRYEVKRGIFNKSGVPITYKGLQVDANYVWRVDVNGAQGVQAQFYPGFQNPGSGSRDCSLYLRFVWDPAPAGALPPNAPGTKFVLEHMYLMDLDQPASNSYPKPFTSPDDNGVQIVNDVHFRKTYDPREEFPNPKSRGGVREYWVLDPGYPDFEVLGPTVPMTRLLPARNYAWRVLYEDAGGLKYWDTNGDGVKGPGEDYAWADGQSDTSNGWTFTTVHEYNWPTGGTTTSGDVNPDVESMIVYWQSPYGSGARDPVEGDWTFAAEANALATIHRVTHAPSVDTLIVSSEMCAASYGEIHNDATNHKVAKMHAQQPFVQPITQWPDGRPIPGWWTMPRAVKATKGFLIADPEAWFNGYYEASPQDHFEPWITFGIRTFLQDTTNGYPWYNGGFTGYNGQDDRASYPNLQYVVLLGDGERISPSFYHYYDAHPPEWVNNWHWTPTDFFYATQTAEDVVSPFPRFQVGRIPLRRAGVASSSEAPVITKIRDYALLLNSEDKKNAAYRDWFGRVVMISGASNWFQWYQSLPGIAQYLLGLKVDTGGGIFRDLFSGMRVHKVDIFSTGSEALTRNNVLRYLVNSDPNDVAGLVFLLCEGSYDGFIFNATGGAVQLTPTTGTGLAIGESDFPPTFPTAFDGRRPLVICPSSCAARYDDEILDAGAGNYLSIGQNAVLANGGPIGFIGFAEGFAYVTETWTRNVRGTTQQMTDNWADNSEGHQWPLWNNGVLELSKNGDPEAALAGKYEFVKLVAQEFGKTTQPGIGDIYNKALDDYVMAHQEDLYADNQRVTSVVFGATLLGDPALVMPQLQRAVKDSVRPVLTATNPRPAAQYSGYDDTPQYNSQTMPVHIIPHSQPYDPTVGAAIPIEIQTDAPYVRVRVLTPFLRNDSLTSGGWFSTTEVPENATEVHATTNGAYTYTFNATTPSVYLLIVQAQSPAWVEGVDSDDWRWGQERWIYVQAVNEFVRDNDSNILVVDYDQTNRYHLGMYMDAQLNTMFGFETDQESYYVNPAIDGLGYVAGVDDPRNLPMQPVLPLLNNEAGTTPAYKYMYWCGQPYESGAINGAAIKAGQRYYGEITPKALKSFQDSRGVVIWYGGDFARPTPGSLGEYIAGYVVLFTPVEEADSRMMSSFINNGGRFFLSEQTILDTLAGATPPVTGAYVSASYMPAFVQTELGATGQVLDLDLTNMRGLRANTFSALIHDVNVSGGDGANNDSASGEIDPNGASSLLAFNWDVTSGPPGRYPPQGTTGNTVQVQHPVNGGRSIFTTMAAEAIDHAGDLGLDNSGRENVLKQAIDYLRSVPKAANPDPANLAVGVSQKKVLSWSRVAEAADYRLYIGTNQLTFTNGDGIIVDRDAHSYIPPDGLIADTRYYWRVDTRNVDDYTIGDVWTFNTVAPAPQANTPNPPNGATQVPLTQVLSWTKDNQVDTYDVSIWENGVAFGNKATNLTVASYAPPGGFNPKMSYTWRVDSRNELGVTTGVVWSFSTITEPPAPVNPDPPNGAVSVPTNKVLGWSSTLRTDQYDVFVWPLGAPAPTAGSVAATFNRWSGTSTTNSYAPGELPASTTCFWQVRPVNAAGRQNTVTTWTFTTSSVIASPLAATNPSPADGSAGIARIVTLSWNKAPGASTYDVYFWQQGDPVPTAPQGSALTAPTMNAPGTPLTIGVTYNWRVIPKNSNGVTGSGSIWTFTVGAAKVTGMIPTAGQRGVLPSITFDWDDASGAVSYNLYYAKGTALVGVAAIPLSVSTYKPPVDLDTDSVYVWRVDSVSPASDVTTGDVLTFTVGTATGIPDAVSGMYPKNGAIDIPTNVKLRWNPAAGAGQYLLYFGAGGLPLIPIALDTTEYQVTPKLLPLITYSWAVDVVSPDGSIIVPGPTFTFTTASGAKGTGCFIATAAYDNVVGAPVSIEETNCTGSYVLTPEAMCKLNDIRRLRSDFLFNVEAGRDMSAWYYAVGPYAADAIRDNAPAKAAVRATLLNPLSALSRACQEKADK